MKEKELINIIQNVLKSEYIGDDCAYLKDLGIVVSQDSLVEDVHFSLKYYLEYKMIEGRKVGRLEGRLVNEISLGEISQVQQSDTNLSTLQPFNYSTNNSFVGCDVSPQYAYSLGWKSAMVNVSDICASGAEPKYLTIALSIPDYIDEKFIEEFYKGAKDACGDVKIVGGDITGSDKLYISATAIGSTEGRKISSRSNAKIGYKVIVSGEHGNSAKGLEILSEGWMSGGIKVWRLSEDQKAGRQEGKLFTCHCEENAEHSTWQSRNLKKLDCFANARNDSLSKIHQEQQIDKNHSTLQPFNPSTNSHTSIPPALQPSNKFLQSHLMPIARRDFSKQISQNCTQDYAMMDTSDGLGDALMQIAKASNVRLKIDTSKIPHDASVDMNTVLFGGEDYELVAVVPKDLCVDGATEIGEVVEGETGLEIDGEFYTDIEDKLFNHFKRKE